MATTLIVMLAVLLSNAWLWLGRPMVQTVHRCRIAQEADIALAYLTSDLGGCPAESYAGYKLAGQFVGWTAPGNGEFLLCFDSTDNPNGLADWGAPDQVIMYQLVGNALVRWNQTNGNETVVAQNVESLIAETSGDTLELILTFACQGITQTYTLVAQRP
ncbi:MAG TPA: hypothetical protein VG713_06565 [Pirellulales bacterium]|nr:hypothetical protein [Pirellulales bacterium]